MSWGGARTGAGKKSVNGGVEGARTPSSIKLPPALWADLEAQAKEMKISKNALIERLLMEGMWGGLNKNTEEPQDLGTAEYADLAGAARSLVLTGAACVDRKTNDIMRAEDFPHGPVLGKGYGSFGNYLLKHGYVIVNSEGRFSLNPRKKF